MLRRPGWVAGIFFTIVLFSTPLIILAGTGVSYDGNKGTLALTVKEASLKETLKVIGDAVGISIYISPVLDEKLSLSFGPLPLEEAIKRVVHPYNHAIIYEQEKDSTGKTAIRPVSIKIFQKGIAESTLLITEKSPPARKDQAVEVKHQKRKEKYEQRDQDPIQIQKQTTDDYLARKEGWKNRTKARDEQSKAVGSEGDPISPRPLKPDIESP